MKNLNFLSLKIDFILANIVEPIDMMRYAAFHLCLIVCQSNQSTGKWKENFS